MRIKKLEMKNFRGFEELTIEFPEKGSAVFVGVNGAGKTSVLECIFKLLEIIWIERGTFKADDFYFNYNDLKNGASSTENYIKIENRGEVYETIGTFEIGNIDKSKINIDNGVYFYNELKNRISKNSDCNIPFYSIFPTNRIISNSPSLNIRDLSEENQYSASSKSELKFNDFNTFFQWFRNIEDTENEEIRFKKDINFRNKGLEAVRQAIKDFLPNFSNPRVQRQPREELIVEKNGKKLSVSNLSHGEKAMFAMVGDIARRLSIANPSLENPLEGEGIILIDEIELHLHPKWQRTIVPRLEKTFPNIQFILTTHSPQVLSSLKHKNIFVLEDFKLVKNTPHTLWRDSSSILYDLFDVKQHPKDGAAALKELYQLIDAEKRTEAISKLEELEDKMGADDVELIRARMHVDMMDE